MHKKGVISTNRNDRGHKKPPTEEFQENDDQGMVDTWLIESSLLKPKMYNHCTISNSYFVNYHHLTLRAHIEKHLHIDF